MRNINILRAYQIFASRTSIHVSELDEYIQTYYNTSDGLIDPLVLEFDIYRSAFSPEGLREIEDIFKESLRRMHGATFKESANEMRLLLFLSDLAAKGLWEYQLNIGEKLEWFTREFDRLDVPTEQMRLHKWAQGSIA